MISHQARKPFLRYFFCSLLWVATSLSATPEEQTETEEQAEEAQKEAAKKNEQEQAEIKAQFPYSFNDVAAHLVIIECQTFIGKVSGSGFIANADGKTYVYTNQHVIMGSDRFTLITATGEHLNAKGIELSTDRDIARILIDDRQEVLEISKNLALDIPLAVFGNSEGGGVATELYGTVTGVGSELLEVTAQFVSGNSGSPVLNLDKEVIGIASYVQFSAPTEEDEKEENGRFESKTRRFCYRLTGVKFAPVNWRRYNEKYGKPYFATQRTIESLASIIDGWYEAPFEPVPKQDFPDISLNSWFRTHNQMVDRVQMVIEKGRLTRTQQSKIRDEIHESAHDLSSISHHLALQVEKQSKEKALTGFLRGELEGYAYGLDYASFVLDYVGRKMAEYIDNL
jgi:V8-like Glu-specific endopeptidase